MIKVALFGVIIGILVGSIVFVAGRLINPAETPHEAITSRFPEGWGSAPVGEYEKPLAWPSAMPQMSTAEFVAAVTAVERLRPRPRPPQPADAVFNDAQIASIKDRLELSEEQKASWQAVEASLREVVWDRSGGVLRTRLEPRSLERLKQAAAPFVPTLSAKQRSKIEALANIVGLRLNGEGR
jgi:hypothetical protein